MFEHSIYDQDPISEPAPPAQEGDLFHDYEIHTWNLSPRIYKILAISATANILAIIIFGQTSLLTMKGCDSPLVGSVCEALDVVYVGSLLFGTKREYVDVAYKKETLGDMDITYIELPPENSKLTYPDGYFAIANPDTFNPTLSDVNDVPFPMIPTYPGIPNARPMPNNSLLNTRPVYATPRKPVLNLPPDINDTDVADANKPPSNKPSKGNCPPGIPCDGANTSGGTNPTPGGNQTPNSDPVAGVDINKRPMVDLANTINDLLEKKQVNLESAFIVSAKGKLTKEGRLDPKTFQWGPITSQDENMKNVIKSSVEAINERGYLQYLKDLSGKDFNILIQQDDQSISSVIQSEMESPNRANSIKTALTIALDFARKQKSSDKADAGDKDDLELLKGATIETDGKKIILKFKVPKNIAQAMIQRKLAEQKAAAKAPASRTETGSQNANTGG